jgi:hypothetical protein
MKLPEGGPKCEPKHVAVIKWNQCKQFDWFIFLLLCWRAEYHKSRSINLQSDKIPGRVFSSL